MNAHTASAALVHESDIDEITRTVWSMMLGFDLDAVPPDVGTRAPALEGWVEISGAWQGVVTLRCPEPLAREVAAAMFDMPVDDATDDEMRDALGELANMIGGNVKGLLPEPCSLSLPSVDDGGEEHAGRELLSATFRYGEYPVTVVVAEPKSSTDQDHHQADEAR